MTWSRLAPPTPTRDWPEALRAFQPVWVEVPAPPAEPTTVVQITNATTADFDLVLTFFGETSGGTGTARVSAFQDVSTAVRMDLGDDAALYWMATVLAQGSFQPNQASAAYSTDADSFALTVSGVTLTHDSAGWSAPAYDSSQYSVFVGFGLLIRGWAYWAYSAPLPPRQRDLAVTARAYGLVRSTGAERLADPVDNSLANWAIRRGRSYELAFDASGTGHLSPLDDL